MLLCERMHDHDSGDGLQGEIRPWGKTRRSLASVPIPRQLSEELTTWKLRCSDPSPEAFIFASQSGGFLDASNFRHQVLGKLERELGLPKLTFQVIRRTAATLAQKMGTVKDVQGLLRHSRTATTTDVYMQDVREGVRATVDCFHRELKSDGSHKTEEQVSWNVNSEAGPRKSGGECREGN